MTKNTELNRDLIMASLSKFYATASNIATLVSVVEGKNSVSLRLIDWFVTNYCKKNNIEIVRNGVATRYNIYLDYRSQLKAFSKHNFDPFKRRDRIRYFYTPTNYIITTVGQLNFFKWAIENNVIQYIENNHSDIESDLTTCYKTNSETVVPDKPTKDRQKRNELSKSCLQHINIVNMTHSLTFE